MNFEMSEPVGGKPVSAAPFSKTYCISGFTLWGYDAELMAAHSIPVVGVRGKYDKLFIKKITAYNLYKQYTWR